ncbi:hypothetical protein O7622_07310 [Micromonospora sp. WMMD1076]|uniref:hypothetical protein n=1 Tax=Micromonospora sp. WMMD1076 TaxID=3016103 RepID=UPI00249C9734|nr:hypothetical protein [Micromonospora sp. WMMD1076]WFF08358.1 hypothetical protein O7622_07310 [Micromonospora sp. WMMD1076]
MVNQTGHTTDGDVVQPARDYVHHDYRTTKKYYGPPPNPDDQGDDEESSESGSGSGAAAAAGGGGLGVVAVLAVLGYFIFGGDEPFPATSDPWPAEVNQEAVVAAASDWLDKCVKSASATPANCPQSIVETSEVSKAHWAFYGNPLEAPVIHYIEAESRFDMLGTVVVSADYTVSKTSRRVVTPTTYWAKVKWAEGKLDVQEIKEHSAIGDPEVVKQDPKVAWEPMAANLKDAFARCVHGAGSTMPAGCPEWRPPSGAEKIKWSLTDDPLLTARATFDPKFGIYHVKGTYGLAVRYTWLGTTKTDPRNPNYEAWIAPTATGPVVLQIKDAV